MRAALWPEPESEHRSEMAAMLAQPENEQSHAAHRALGFTETERVVYFRKSSF